LAVFSAHLMQESRSVTDKPEQHEAQGGSPVDETGVNPEGVQEQAAAEGTDVEADSELVDLQMALGKAEQELVDHRDAMLRMQAEMENLRKRLIKDLERSRLRALEGFMNDLLPVRDSLERGMETDEATTTVESMKEGKALIIKMLSKVMEDHGLKLIDPAGEPFNPEHHQAMSMMESAEHEPNTVMEVLQKGFSLHDRLVRPAMVIVSKAPD
jgi:molecular chaperone GrpE